jgi:hypothetical protein
MFRPGGWANFDDNARFSQRPGLEANRLWAEFGKAWIRATNADASPLRAPEKALAVLPPSPPSKTLPVQRLCLPPF